MKSTLIPVCGLIAAHIVIQPAFAQQKPNAPKAAQPSQQKANVRKEPQPARVALNAAPTASKPRPVAKKSRPKEPSIDHAVAISPSERHVIRWHVHTCIEGSKGRKPNGLPAGLRKETAYGWGRALPPEWQKQCVRGQVLPAEVHKHCEPLPDELILKLPPCPPGTLLLAVNGRVLRVAYPTYQILDAFDVQ
jgi:hypothetical protein